VVCDRFADSTTVYQGHARGLGVERVLQINELAVDGAVPDITILLDLDVALGFDRVAKRGVGGAYARDRFEREALAFHEEVRKGYLELASRWPARFKVVDASGPEEAVGAEIWRIVESVVT
jgi:dTMP kinase